MYSPTMKLINELSNERQQLWREAGRERHSLTREQQLRLRELNEQIPVLWDEYRRELVTGQTPPRLHLTRPNIFIPEEDLKLA